MAEKIWTFEEAVRCLGDGGIGIYPTETFMALGCRADNAAAARRVYEVKQRAHCLPLPVIAGDRAQVEGIAHMPPEAEDLIERFWPGPLTVLLPARSHVPFAVTGGTGYLAVRISAHPGARRLALAAGGALAASSANISGARPAVSVETLDPLLLSRVDGVWDAPPGPEGLLPSTLVRLLGMRSVHILRPGAVGEKELREAGYKASHASATPPGA